MATLDKLDKKILHILDRQGRITYSQLARKVRQGRDRVEYRVHRLVEQGIISKFSTILDPSRLGLSIFKSYLKLSGTQSEIDRFVKYLYKHPEVYWIAECDGRWDVLFSITANSVHEFYYKQELILRQFDNLIMEFEVYPLVEGQFFYRGYLGSKQKSQLTIGGAPEINSVDEVDLAILRAISTDARTSLTDLANGASVSTDVVRGKLQRLERAGIIRGYRADLNLAKLGMVFFKAQIFYKSLCEKREEEFHEYCLGHPNVIYYVKQIGRCRLEVEVEINDYYAYNELIGEIRGKFADLISNIESTTVKRDVIRWISSS